MRKLILSVIAVAGLLCVSACSDFVFQEETIQSPLTKSGDADVPLESVLFHPYTSTYVVRQSDPYRMDNFNLALRNLRAGVSNQTFSTAQKEYLSKLRLEPTHYALKIYPRNETEQWAIERTEGISISYLPFDCVQLPQQKQQLYKDGKVSFTELAEQSPYTVLYDDLMTEEGPVEPVTVQMPILYVVWPCDMPLPEEYDYVIDYEVFIPNYEEDAVTSANSNSILEKDVMALIEREAINIALGNVRARQSSDIPAPQRRPYAGHLKTSDPLLGLSPLPGLTVRFQLGSNIHDARTDMDGYFYTVALVRYEASFSLVFTHSLWKITRKANSTVPIVYSYGTMADVWVDDAGLKSEISFSIGSGGPELEVLRAVYYYYYGDHEINTWTYKNDGIRICASASKGEGVLGSFYYGASPTYIVIYANNANAKSHRVGTTLHELGHFTQYGERGSRSEYTKSEKWIRESYASYVGWYLGCEYYCHEGYEDAYDGKQDITGNARQRWPMVLKDYTPVFVDMIDDYNQGEHNDDYNVDSIEDFPHSIIRTMITDCNNLEDINDVLGEYLNVYYTRKDYDNFIRPYIEMF